MRKITHIVIHCSATPEGREVSAKEIDRWHRQRGFAKIGYHYVVHLDGSVSQGRREEEPGAHVEGHNATSIGVCYVGGTEAGDVRKPKDTRTEAQKASLCRLVSSLASRYPDARVLGHADFPGVHKACPVFDVQAWWAVAREGISTEYVIATPGDSLSKIARAHGLSLSDIRKLNPGLDRLQVGQCVRVS